MTQYSVNRVVYKGKSTSVYLSELADRMLDECSKSTRRSKSAIVSMLIERWCPALARTNRIELE